jgi:2,3-dihydroxybenzoate decarboxylase
MKFAQTSPKIRLGLTSFEERIRVMDETGVDMHVIGLTVPGVQMIPGNRAIALARDLNDELAQAVGRYPDRLVGLGSVPPQLPEEAAKEIGRVVDKLGLNGIIINSHTDGEYLDEPKYEPVLAAAEEAGAPVYIHPRQPGRRMLAAYAAHGAQAAIWGYAAETGLHIMRLILSGVFDRHPKLQIVIGHAGEGIPYWFYRIDNMYKRAFARSAEYFRMTKLELPPSAYFKRNISISTSGMDDPEVLDFCIRRLGAERVMFAIDYPYEDAEHATRFLRDAPLSSKDRRLVSHANAERIFGIRPDCASVRAKRQTSGGA